MRKRPQAILAVLSRRATMSERKLCANTRIHDINGRTIKKTQPGFQVVFPKFIPNKKAEAFFPKTGFHLYSWVTP